MAILEKVTQMRNQGIPDDQIISNLRQQGVSPNEINNALNQADIKSAVTGPSPEEIQAPGPQQNLQQYPMTQENQPQQYYSQQPYAQQTNQQNYPQMQQQEAYPQQEYYQEQNYPQEEYYPQENYNNYYPQEGFDSNTLIEISEQVFSEKIKKTEKIIENLNEFKTITQTKVENIDERLKKLETMIDKLQITILEKIGSYGNNLDSIKKEMGMMQDSFGKIVNNVADKQTQSSSIPIQKKKTTKKVSE